MNNSRRRFVFILSAFALPAGAATLTPTPRQTEGPYYKSGSPQRTALLEPDMPGVRVVIRGRVLTTAGAPVKGAWLDFWQSDAGGRYDNRGYRLRGHQYTDDDGRYALETVVPGSYPGRTPHIHVKIAVPNHPPLTTQIYFPGEAQNRRDWLFDSALLVQRRNDKEATFDFILE